ncbi:pyridoxine kinase [Faunimonas pinastri]|uniref:pyridoxal kinase n=1 Tax=Faunimonas pinastri TaxID=1855383 RepID=A0A1H9KT37_9HYPH|nr:pyridoxal kinase PdxY [Faunimonas pinastri]SER02320.1 pyridoxine kinase [Faunimonas pinastri]
MNVLSIQSHVAYGHAGNASAIFPMQRLGVEVWPIHTVQFSNHTGYGAWRGQVFAGDTIRELVAGIADRGVLPSCDGVLSGYMGDVGIGEAIVEAVEQVKAANPRALYCCDPVLGDVGRGFFVRPGIPEFMRDRAITRADVITPNHFELEFLTGTEIRTRDELRRAMDALHKKGPKTILVTSLHIDGTPDDAIDIAVSGEGRISRIRTPLLPAKVNGAGDAIAALFFVHLLKGSGPVAALEKAGSSIYGLLRRTAEANSPEILTIAAQDEFVTPTTQFEAMSLD